MVDSTLEDRVRAARDASDWAAAATALIAGYGPEILRYLVSLAPDRTRAADAFSRFCESVWLALPEFRADATFRVWCYSLARYALSRELRDPNARADRRVPLSEVPSAEQAMTEVRARTAEYLRSETKDRLARVRASLHRDDQALLVLRINRQLGWSEIAHALAEPDEALTPKQLAQRSAALRKRYQRIKDELRAVLAPDPGRTSRDE